MVELNALGAVEESVAEAATQKVEVVTSHVAAEPKEMPEMAPVDKAVMEPVSMKVTMQI